MHVALCMLIESRVCVHNEDKPPAAIVVLMYGQSW